MTFRIKVVDNTCNRVSRHTARSGTNTITISPSSTTGEPGEEIDVTIMSPQIRAVVTGQWDFDDTRFLACLNLERDAFHETLTSGRGREYTSPRGVQGILQTQRLLR